MNKLLNKENFKENIVIGAGIAGLSAACKLKEEHADFLIFEKQSQLGGNWDSRVYKNSIYELGPNTIIDKSEALRNLITKAGLEDEVISHQLKDSKRYFFRNNRFFEVSSNPLQLIFSKLLSLKAKLRLCLEPFIKSKSDHTESVFDFFSRRLGKDFAEDIIGPALQGIWGGDIKQLNMSVSMPFIHELEKNHSSLLKGLLSSKRKKKKDKLKTISFKKGLQNLCIKLEDYLGKEQIKLDVEVIEIEREDGLYKLKLRKGQNQDFYYCKNLYLTSPAQTSSKLIKKLNPELSEALSQIYYAPMYLIAYSIKKERFENKGNYLNAFGFLNAFKAHFTLGTIFASKVFKERELDDEYLFVSFLGGARNSQITEFEAKDLSDLALTEAKEIFDNALELQIELEDIDYIDSKLIKEAIPQYNDRYLAAKIIIDKVLDKESNLHLLGNYMNGVSIVDTVEDSQKISKI